MALATCPPAAAEVVPERGSISFRYLDYVDRQPDLERIRIKAPAVLLTVPIAGAWLVEGSYVADAVSGASPAYHTVVRSAAKITDRREAVSAGLTRYSPWGTLKVGAAFSTESDYVSRALSAQGSIASEDKNTTVNFGIGYYCLLAGYREKAVEYFNKAIATNQWSSFGYIAAETELNRMK